MEKNASTGGCLNGSYFWYVDFLIVKEASIEMLEKVIADLIKEKTDLGMIFSLCEPDLDLELD
jgi:hypothetical protein